MKLAAFFESSSLHFIGCMAKESALRNLMLCETLIIRRNGANVSSRLHRVPTEVTEAMISVQVLLYVGGRRAAWARVVPQQ